MISAPLDHLCNAVWDDTALQQRLHAAPDLDAFLAHVTKTARELNLSITPRDVLDRMRANVLALSISSFVA